ncbi:arginine repressor [Clostridia bacterium]|nr:arginine repressor [Clostridia bacterium]
MKQKRWDTILNLISSQQIETQEELLRALSGEGFEVTQSTVSRDIRELRLVKLPLNGKFVYGMSSSRGEKKTPVDIKMFAEGIVSVDISANILVIKTRAGMAMALAATIDDTENAGVLGTIAGDDTIFCVLRNKTDGTEILQKFREMLKEGVLK